MCSSTIYIIGMASSQQLTLVYVNFQLRRGVGTPHAHVFQGSTVLSLLLSILLSQKHIVAVTGTVNHYPSFSSTHLRFAYCFHRQDCSSFLLGYSYVPFKTEITLFPPLYSLLHSLSLFLLLFSINTVYIFLQEFKLNCDFMFILSLWLDSEFPLCYVINYRCLINSCRINE